MTETPDPREFITELELSLEAAKRGPCPDCAADWTIEHHGTTTGLFMEHEDSCPS